MAKITAPQMRKIYAVAREQGIDKETLYELVEATTSSSSIKALTVQQANDVIDRLVGKQTIKGYATEKQKAYIRNLTKDLGRDDPKRLRGFLKKYTKVDDIKWLTQRQASNVIEGLKRQLVAKQLSEEDAKE